MLKTTALVLAALGAGAAAGSWDQGSASLTWTLSLLGGAAFLLSALAPRQAAGIVAMLAAGVLATHVAGAAPSGLERSILHEGLIAAAVAALIAATAALLGAASSLTLSRWSRR